MRRDVFSKSIVPILVLISAFFFQALAFQVRAENIPQAVTLTLGDYRFDPDNIEVQPGQPVVLTLVSKDGVTPHNFTLQDTAAGLDTDTSVSAGSTSTIEITPEKPGTYTILLQQKTALHEKPSRPWHGRNPDCQVMAVQV